MVLVGEFVDWLFSVIVWPTSIIPGNGPITASGRVTDSTTVMIACVVSEPASLLAVRDTENCPGELNEWVGALPVSADPSPKLHSNRSGSPVDWSKNCRASPTSTVAVSKVKSAVGTRNKFGATTVKSND